MKARGKRASGAVLLAASGFAFAAPPVATELPTGGQVVGGSAGIVQSGATMNITQTTSRAAIDWQTFNIGSAAHVNFDQPSSSSVALNQVLDSNPSQIFGRLTANGQVFLTNPNGEYFSPSASVNVGGLVATTHSISLSDFMSGNFSFTRNGATGSVVNEGNLTASLGGYIALLAPEVRNQGVVVARLGTAALAAGDSYNLQFADGRLAGIQVTPSTIRALVENRHAVEAPGGLIILSALAADQLQGGIVSNDGTLAANSLTDRGGVIRLEGDTIIIAGGSLLDASGATGGGSVLVGGGWQGSGGMHMSTTLSIAATATLDASATDSGDGGTVVAWSDVNNAGSQTSVHGTLLAKGGAHGGNGGRIETSGHQVDVAGITANASAANGTGGLWLLDPTNVTISSSPAVNSVNWAPTGTGSNILVTDLMAALNAGTSVTVTTTSALAEAGNINVNASVAKTAGGAATLVLKAHNDITLAAGVGITSTSGALNVTLNSDSDGVAGGAIQLLSGSSIVSNGGNITLGGGVAGDGSGYAVGSAPSGFLDRGVYLLTSTLNAGGGNISIKGKGWQGAALAGLIPIGIDDLGGTIITTSGAGSITLNGIGGNTANGLNPGVNMFAGAGSMATTIYNTGTGAISLTGVAGPGALRGGTSYDTGNSYIYSTGGGAISLTGTGSNALNSEGISSSATGGTLSLGFNGATTYASPITLTADTMNLTGMTVKSTGSLLVQPLTAGTTIGIAGGTGTLQLLSAYFGSNFVNGFSNITIGSATTGNITANGFTFADNLTLWAGNANATANLSGVIANAGAGLSSGSLTVKAAGDIVSTAAITTQNQAVTLNSDSDATGGGAIVMNSGSSIVTNGGNIVMGGGVDPTVGYATGNATNIHGINLVDSLVSLNSGGGNISIRGMSFAGGLVQPYVGVSSNATINSGAGTITLDGISQGTGSANSQGLIVNGLLTSSNGIWLSGSSVGSTNAEAIGVNLGGTILATNGASIHVIGNGGTTSRNFALSGTISSPGIILNGASILSGSGMISLTGTGGSDATMSAIIATGGTHIGQQAGSAITSSSSQIVLNTDTLSLTGTDYVQSSGTLTIAPRTAGTTIGIGGGAGTLQLLASYFNTNFMPGFSSVTIGDATAGAITIGGATTFGDNTALVSGGNIAINGNLNDAGKILALTGGIGATVSGSGNITAAGLLLNGVGANYVLNTATGNSVGTLAADSVAGLSFTNSGALTIGSIGPFNGVMATGPVSIETLTGDLTIAQDMLIADATANALLLNAGKATAAGTATGGNIVISGPPGFAPPMLAMLVGGRATLMSGSIGGSAGVANWVGAGSGNFRYNSDEAATNYTSALGAGVFAVYREQPTITVTANAATKTYDGLAYAGGNGTTYGGFVNGDTANVLGGALTYGGTAQGATNAGNYAIAPGGLNNGLGYALSYANGALTVNPAPLVVTANGAIKTYDGLAYSGGNGVSYAGLVNGETSAVLGGALTYGGTSQGATNAGGYTIAPGGLTSGNYTISYVNGALTVNPAPLVVTANNALKTYDGLAYTGGNGVTYSGLVNGETSAVLGGVLTYGGTAQGATNSGNYVIAPGGLSSGNYTISYINGALTVNPAPLVVTANGALKTYDGLAYTGGNGVSYAGLVNGETSAVLGGALTYGGTAQGATNAGNYAIAPSGLTSGNYAISYINGALTVNPAPLVVTANGALKTYDGLAYSGGNGVSYAGLVNGETSAVLGGTLSYGGTAQGATNAGNYAIAPSGLTSGNYAISYVNGALTVNPAPLVVTANGAVKTYDGLAYTGGNGVTYSGLVNGETSAVLGGALNYGGTSQGATNAGNYAIAPSGLTSGNYTISYVNGALTVNPAPLVVTANGALKTYDGLAYTGGNGVTYSGLVNGETSAVLGGVLSYGGTAQGATNAGNYAIAPSGLTSGNYTISYVNGALTVNPAPLVVTANGALKTYDGLAYSGGNGVTYSGLVNGETSAVLGGTLNYGGTAQGATNAGNYAIAPSGLISGNYTISYVNGALTVNPAPLVVTANGAVKTYDGLAYSGGNGVSYAGLVNGETSAVLGGTLSYGGTAQGATNAGNYVIAPGGLTSGNYAITFANGVLTINPSAPPMVTPPTPMPPPVSPTSSSPLIDAAPEGAPVSDTGVPTQAGGGGETTPPTAATSTPVAGPVAGGGGVPGNVASGPATTGGGTTVPDPNIGPNTGGATAAGPVADTGVRADTVTPATATALATTLSSADNPASALDSMAAARVQNAIDNGMSPAQAARAGNAYSAVVARQLSRGATMSEAAAHAEQVFQAEAAFPSPKSPQEAAARNLASGGDASKQLAELSQAKTSSGSATFDKVLASSLASGMSFGDAVNAANAAAQTADAMAGTDRSPQGTLANGGTGQFANRSSAFQKSLSNLLAKGYTPEQAMQRATQIAESEAAAAQADARNPASSLASGNMSALPETSGDSFDVALGAALASGLPLDVALQRARQIDAAERRAIEADMRNPATGFSSGRQMPIAADAVFDQAVANAIARGESPARALAGARQVVSKLDSVKPSALGALASGKQVDAMPLGAGSSRTYRTVLSKALSRGVPVDDAVALAKRAEQANAFRYCLPAKLAQKLPPNGAGLKVTTQDGKPLPTWLHFSPQKSEFVSVEVPDGALPMTVTIRVGNRTYSVDLS